MSAKMKSAFLALAAALSASCAMASAVAKIGNSEYETLQAALDAASGKTCKVKLLADVDVMQPLALPYGTYNATLTLDGNGHTIRQAAATRVFYAAGAYAYLTLTNITVLGGGEACSTASDASLGIGTVIKCGAGTGNYYVTLDSGTVVSNFWVRGHMFEINQGTAKINDGAIITCNRASDAAPYMGCVFKVTSGSVIMNGGEISCNAGNYGTAVLIRNSSGKFTMYGGVIKGNDCLRSVQNGGVVNAYEGGTVTIKGGLITGNTCSAAGSGYVTPSNNVKTPGVILTTTNPQLKFYGGKIIGNDGAGVYIMQNAGSVVQLSGYGIIAGNAGPGICRSSDSKVAIALVGDFSGYVDVYTTYTSTYVSSDDKWIVATNAANYAGAENIHAYNYPNRIGVQAEGTQNIWLRTPNEAKIGGTAYATFSSAVSSAASGAKIELLRDVVDKMPVPPAKTLTIDGCGHRIYRCKASDTNMFNFATAGASLTLTNVALWGGFSTAYSMHTNGNQRGSAALMRDGVAATLTIADGVTFKDFEGTKALFAVGEGSTLNLDGAAMTNLSNKAVDATGGTVGIRGATFVHDNEGGDIDVANGGILSLYGDLTGRVHVTVAGLEAYDGQWFGTATGAWSGLDRFVNGGSNSKLHVSGNGGKLTWCKRGFVMLVQ